ncbi:MAG: hypothetical protein JWO03_2006 [Bacteroidetes bacterium]|nr:hypothetical protein [Bacteroidota bacterium]
MKVLFSGALLLLMCSAVIAQNSDDLKLNQIQVIGSHNSYKKLPDPRVMKFMMKMRKRLGADADPIRIDYGHMPFDSQFAYHMRGLEIDIYNDPKGGTLYKRKINAFVHGVPVRSGVEELRKPGFKVLHIKDVDYQTHYYTFKESLIAVKKWSDAHPNHLPIFINVEPKTGGPADHSKTLRFLGFKRVVPFDSAAYDAIDAEIRSVFGDDLKSILTPDKLRGKYASLGDMAQHNGWPALDECRGKIVLIMLGGSKTDYLKGHPELAGRAMCVYGREGKSETAFIMQDESIGDSANIIKLIKEGYIVRTRSDIETMDARANDPHRKIVAMQSGAQIISTDYYVPDLRLSNFEVQWDGKHSGRVNPILLPQRAGEWVKE